MKKIALVLLVATASASCNKPLPIPEPTPIPFASHPSILRGVWTGRLTNYQTADQSLRLDLSANYETSSRYSVAGTGKVGADALTVTGSVVGGSLHSYLQSQTTPAPETAKLSLQRPEGEAFNLICESTVRAASAEATSIWRWNCYVESNKSATVTLEKETP